MSADARGTTREVTSRDGTKIACESQGQGPTVILVAGAFTTRLGWSGTGLSRLLAPEFTVISYDRRGRGESGNILPYALEREIEDIEVLIDGAGGKASLYGHSSGAALALEAALRLGDKVGRLALYEAPYNDNPTAVSAWKEYIKELTQLLAQDRRGDAVALFMKYLGTPAEQIEGMRHAPMWSGLADMAHTLAYDHTVIMGESASVPAARAARIKAGTLVTAGSASYPFMQETARTLSAAIPGAQLRILEGQTHDVNAEVQAPILAQFFRK